jgi:large conductance mechanosensitive channel
MQVLMKEFRTFLLRGNLVDMAVGIVIGIAFAALVTALVTDLITPIIAAIVGKPDFSGLSFTIHKSRFLYGDFINAVLAFVSIAAAVFFFVVKPINYLLERRRRALAAGDEPDAAELSDEAAILTEIRDLLRDQGSRSLG